MNISYDLPPARMLFDTNILITGHELVDGTISAMAGHESTTGGISIITMIELAAGIAASTGSQRQKRLDRYKKIQRTFSPIPVDKRILAVAQVIDEAILAIGRTPRNRRMDLLIAATAITEEVPLLTLNPDDFRGLEELLEVKVP